MRSWSLQSSSGAFERSALLWVKTWAQSFGPAWISGTASLSIPGRWSGTYPVPAERTDLMVGITVRKAFETREWSERLKRIGNAKGNPLPPYRYKLKMYLDMCEQVYMDCLSNRSILGIYTEKARRGNIPINPRGFSCRLRLLIFCTCGGG